jgi:predicted Rdx family selenoprotein
LAQECLQTFGLSLGEVALLPSTSGIFVIKLYHQASNDYSSHDTTNGHEVEVKVQETTIWDRKVDGGFPETKELKNRVRNVVEPGRGLGHTDRALNKGKQEKAEQDHREVPNGGGKDAEGNAGNVGVGERQQECEDCK